LFEFFDGLFGVGDGVTDQPIGDEIDLQSSGRFANEEDLIRASRHDEGGYIEHVVGRLACAEQRHVSRRAVGHGGGDVGGFVGDSTVSA
jgi:hypothetical protein